MSIKSVYITSIGKTLTRDVMKPLKTALSCHELILILPSLKIHERANFKARFHLRWNYELILLLKWQQYEENSFIR